MILFNKKKLGSFLEKNLKKIIGTQINGEPWSFWPPDVAPDLRQKSFFFKVTDVQFFVFYEKNTVLN